jgi:hypothetical protein
LTSPSTTNSSASYKPTSGSPEMPFVAPLSERSAPFTSSQWFTHFP